MVELIEKVDFALLNWLRAPSAPWLDAAMTWISASGGAGIVWLVLAAVAFIRPRDRAAAWRVLLTIALAYSAVDGVAKPFVARPRPALVNANPTALAPKRALPPVPRTYSFPSGHATSTFGAAVAVSRMWPQTRVVWWVLAILIGYSRIYLGHHYPLDVVGGAVLGSALAFWVLGGFNRATYASSLPRPLPPELLIRP
jgi:undecaprenyl-diphosphatase